MEEEDQIQSGPRQRLMFITRVSNKLHRYKILLGSKFWILLVTIGLGVAVQFVLSRHAPPMFLSVGRMIVNLKLSIPDAQAYTEELDNFYGTQIALMKSDSVKNQVLLRLQVMQATNAGLFPSPVAITATVSPKTSIFNLQAVGNSPEYTREYLEASMEEYINLKRELLDNAANATKSGMQNEIAQLVEQLQASHQQLLDFQASNSVVFLQPDGGNHAAEYLTQLTQQLSQDQSELNLLNSLSLDENLQRQNGVFDQNLKRSEAAPSSKAGSTDPATQTGATANGNDSSGGPAAPVTTAAGNVSPGNGVASGTDEFAGQYLESKKRILFLKESLNELSQNLRPAHPRIIEINKEIEHEEKLLEIFRGQSQENLENTRHTLEVEIRNLQSSIQEWALKAVEVSRQLDEYQAIKSNDSRLQNMYDQLTSAMQTLNVGEQVGQESVTILEAASTPAPVSPQKARHYALAILLGLIAGIVVLMVLDRFDDRLTNYHELAELFDESILAQIPREKTQGNGKFACILQPNDGRFAFAESFRNLRSSLVFMDHSQKQPTSIAISSAIPNDGKSTVTANLAITLARAGARVLLVDADLRRGTLHKYFNLPQVPGLTEVLTDQCDWSKALVESSVPNLYLIPSGKPAANSGELLAKHSTRFLENIAGKYDFYIFDTAPIMATDDVCSLAPHLSGLVMVVRAGFTSARVARAALDLLRMRKVNVLGLVFNAVRPESSEYGYKYKEYYTVDDSPA